MIFVWRWPGWADIRTAKATGCRDGSPSGEVGLLCNRCSKPPNFSKLRKKVGKLEAYALALPQPANAVGIERRIGTDDGRSLDLRLGDQEPIKWVAVVKRQRCRD